MKSRTATTVLWGIGLGPEERRRIGEYAGVGFQLRSFNISGSGKTPGEKDLEKDEPLVLFIPLQAWNALSVGRKRLYQTYDNMQRVLLLQPDDAIEELEKALGKGFMEIMRTPLKESAIQSVLERATEMKSVYGDIYRMTQEIYLERELLARKNEHLSFINRFVSRVSESLEPAEILKLACEEISQLFPVKLIQGAVWNIEKDGSLDAELYLANTENTQAEDEWVAFISESILKLAMQSVKNYRITRLEAPHADKDIGNIGPQPGRVAIIPMNSGAETFGCLVMLSEKELRLGRDQVELLNSAAKHLSLALRNAQMYNEVRNQAQFDGLTKLYNRRHLDVRLEEELLRHHRYMHELSVLILDLDYFKNINDTYGHEGGDIVLQEVGKMLTESVRTTDFAARYGGEEFAIILPQTSADQALVLAERIRVKIARRRFAMEDNFFNVTASIGIATLPPGAFKPKSDLLREADKALYTAKAKGRNQVMVANDQEAQAELMRA